MKHVISMGLLTASAAALFAFATPVFATPITQAINLGTVFTGTTPNGTAPWLVGAFMYEPGTKTGTLTLQSNLSGGNFVKGQGTNAGWGFFLNGNTLLTLSCTVGTTCASSTVIGSFGTTGPVDGGFDLGFVWNANVFTGNVSAVYALSFEHALNSDPFGPNSDGWTSVAHIQGITVTGCDTSGWIVDNNSNGIGAGMKVCGGGVTPPPVGVPEPSSLGILGLGTLLLGAFIGLRRRFS